MTDDSICTQCNRPYTEKPCGLTHLAIKDKIVEKYGDKTWPPTTLEHK